MEISAISPPAGAGAAAASANLIMSRYRLIAPKPPAPPPDFPLLPDPPLPPPPLRLPAPAAAAARRRPPTRKRSLPPSSASPSPSKSRRRDSASRTASASRFAPSPPPPPKILPLLQSSSSHDQIPDVTFDDGFMERAAANSPNASSIDLPIPEWLSASSSPSTPSSPAAAANAPLLVAGGFAELLRSITGLPTTSHVYSLLFPHYYPNSGASFMPSQQLRQQHFTPMADIGFVGAVAFAEDSLRSEARPPPESSPALSHGGSCCYHHLRPPPEKMQSVATSGAGADRLHGADDAHECSVLPNHREEVSASSDGYVDDDQRQKLVTLDLLPSGNYRERRHAGREGGDPDSPTISTSSSDAVSPASATSFAFCTTCSILKSSSHRQQQLADPCCRTHHDSVAGLACAPHASYSAPADVFVAGTGCSDHEDFRQRRSCSAAGLTATAGVAGRRSGDGTSDTAESGGGRRTSTETSSENGSLVSTSAGSSAVIVPRAVRPVGSVVSLESVSEVGTEGEEAADGVEVVSESVEEVRRELEKWRDPAFVTDEDCRVVRWVNEAYRRMVGGQKPPERRRKWGEVSEKGEEVPAMAGEVTLRWNVGLPAPPRKGRDYFCGRANMEWTRRGTGERSCMTVPCDVKCAHVRRRRVAKGGAAAAGTKVVLLWRLDVAASLSLSPLGLAG